MACKDPRFRQRILDEIVSTEVTYVNNLKTLKEVYIVPLRTKGFMTKDDIDTIFQNWEMLLGFNMEFLDHLKEATEIGVEGCKVGSLFKRFAPFFRMTSVYLGAFDKALEYKEELIKKVRRLYSHRGFPPLSISPYNPHHGFLPPFPILLRMSNPATQICSLRRRGKEGPTLPRVSEMQID